MPSKVDSSIVSQQEAPSEKEQAAVPSNESFGHFSLFLLF